MRVRAAVALDLARLLGIYNVLPVEIRALDPGRNTSVVRFGEHEIVGEYYPGKLKGDRLHLLVTPRQLKELHIAVVQPD